MLMLHQAHSCKSLIDVHRKKVYYPNMVFFALLLGSSYLSRLTDEFNRWNSGLGIRAPGPSSRGHSFTFKLTLAHELFRNRVLIFFLLEELILDAIVITLAYLFSTPASTDACNFFFRAREQLLLFWIILSFLQVTKYLRI
ncbi:hypothetical protein BDW59DRAFT_146406 [Aspergillus cavernicola]|uniref:Uncharacterized protein n=1 Tax=Aspergillus cavernicola TaxID=176166 RepID=A0ABR4ICH3_9EURO